MLKRSILIVLILTIIGVAGLIGLKYSTYNDEDEIEVAEEFKRSNGLDEAKF